MITSKILCSQMRIDISIEEVSKNPFLEIAKLISSERRKVTTEPPPIAEKVSNFANAQGLLDTASTQA